MDSHEGNFKLDKQGQQTCRLIYLAIEKTTIATSQVMTILTCTDMPIAS
jgi:hypothetical protein